MSDSSNTPRTSPKNASRQELLRIISALTDGVDGFESEHGNLKYWNAEMVEKARGLLETSPAAR